MDHSAVRPFAQRAKALLRAGVERRVITVEATIPSEWAKLKAVIAHSSLNEVVETAACTWFHRLLAMKILSKNGYEAAQLDYLSDETRTPAIVERARRGQYTFLTDSEMERLQPLLTDDEKEQEAFTILVIGYCRQHPLLQAIFGTSDDYTELLLPDDILTENGFLHLLNVTDAISDDDYRQVELIGWLHQFFISEKKDEVFAGFKQNKKAEARDIPAATQIFTPNWIVKYLVQNTLGRTWLDAHPDSELRSQWNYLVEPSSPSPGSSWEGELETCTFLDPAAGSGHILVEAFDALYSMYLAEYYSPEAAVKAVLEKNLFGLDLDLHAVQLAQFSVVLKAAQYSRTILQGKMLPHVYSMPSHRIFSKEEVALFLGNENAALVKPLFKALQIMEQAPTLGSVMVLELSEDAKKKIEDRYRYWLEKPAVTPEEQIIKEVFPAYIPVLLILTNKFVCIAANPPYMGQKNMNTVLKNYVNAHYPLGKRDLFAVFMDVCSRLLQNNGRYGAINMHSWMFLSSYEELRKKLLEAQTIEHMLHLGPRTFDELNGEVVQNTAFVVRNKQNIDAKGSYFRLVDFRNNDEKKEAFRKKVNEFPNISQTGFRKIPRSPIAYWVTEKALRNFDRSFDLKEVGDTRQGMATSDNERFTRMWHEISIDKVGFLARTREEARSKGKKWFPYNKGGGFRKWYGNQNVMVNWENDGEEILEYASSLYGSATRTIKSISEYFKSSLSWSKVSGGDFAIRFYPHGFIFDVAGCCIFLDNEKYRSYLCCLLNSKVANYYLEILSPTLNYEAGSVASFPVIEQHSDAISTHYSKAIEISKSDWDSRETSWDFWTNPLVAIKQGTLQQSYEQWLYKASDAFFQLHANEEYLNRVFIDIYDLQEELSPEVCLKDISILQEEIDYDALQRMGKPYKGKLVPVHADVVMQQLVSYIVGCSMGRYCLSKPGLHIAHPHPTDVIIPMMGSNGNFTDDMLHRAKEFLSIIWGDDGLTENINFLQQQLDKSLEDYLVKDFWKDHVNKYSKRPVYWLFASKNGAFQVLVYMHRMSAHTPANIRNKYLLPHISWLQHLVADMEKNAASLGKDQLKKRDTYRKQLAECQEYDLLLKDIAGRQISLDLDEGVAKNYALFKGVVAGIK